MIVRGYLMQPSGTRNCRLKTTSMQPGMQPAVHKSPRTKVLRTMVLVHILVLMIDEDGIPIGAPRLVQTYNHGPVAAQCNIPMHSTTHDAPLAMLICHKHRAV